MSALQKIEDNEIRTVQAPITPMEMLNSAVERGASFVSAMERDNG